MTLGATLESRGQEGGLAPALSKMTIPRPVKTPYRELRIPDSGHWVQNEAVDEVNTALIEFLNVD